jgi:CheY-like chemotaxis protein
MFAPAPHRILLVDDNADERDAIAVFLELEGADVVVAGDGEEALNVLRADPLRCVIVLDLNMPVMDGWEFRRRQLLSALAGIPVVVVSGHPDLAVAIRGMATRAALRKPVDLDRLLVAVNEHCGGH